MRAPARRSLHWPCWPTISATTSKALQHHDAFMRGVVAELDNAWRLTSADIDEALGRLGIKAA